VVRALAASKALQFGHGGGAVEDATPSAPPGGRGPNFNSATAVEPWRTTLARELRRIARELQFGHGGGAVEDLALAILAPDGGGTLQFGHGGGAVEDANPRTPRVTNTRDFNSATAVEPWRTSIGARATATPVALQFGHGGGAVEDMWPGTIGRPMQK